MNQWYYADQGQQRGPVGELELIEMRRLGSVNDNTLVWREGMAEWKRFAVCLEAPTDRISPPPSPFAPPRAPVYEAPLGSAVHGGPVVYGGFLRRWVALIVDAIILYLPLMVVAAVMGAVLGPAMEGNSAAGLLYLMWLLCVPCYYAFLESSSWQATLGKRLLGIKVVDLEGQRISFGRALGRWFAASLSYLTLYIGFLLAALTDRKQALHDFIASTLVVDRWAYTDSPERQQQRLPALVIVLILGLVLIVPLSILAAIAIPAYNDYLLRAKGAEVLGSASPAKLAVTEFVFSESRCPQDWAELPRGSQPVSPLIGESLVGEFDGGGCGIEIKLANSAPAKLAGNHFYLSFDSDSNAWTCSSDIDSRYLPSGCR